MHKLSHLAIFTSVILAACSGQAAPAASPQATAIQLPVTPTSSAACQAIQAEPTPGPETPSLFPAVESSDWAQGPSGAAVTIIEYGDFQ
jgi:hypothetical protein